MSLIDLKIVGEVIYFCHINNSTTRRPKISKKRNKKQQTN